MKELDFIKALASRFPQNRNSGVLKSIGDDCAVFSSSNDKENFVVTTDMLVEDIHFSLKWHDFFQLGRKIVSVNMSDIAAMGAVCKYLLLSASLPVYIDESRCKLLLDGMSDALQGYECELIGGDTTTGEKLVVSATAIGLMDGIGYIGRNGAREGDSVYVSGNPGSAAAGLYICQNHLNDEIKEKYQTLLDEHLNPQAQTTLGRLLAESGMVSAMQDVSDGLATDLAHICSQSCVSAIIEKNSIPHSAKLLDFSDEFGLPPEDFSLYGGDDYQLVFTVNSEKATELEKLISCHKDIVPISKIGRIQEGQGVFLEEGGQLNEISFKGYQHNWTT